MTSRSSKANNTSGPPGPHKAGSGRRQGSYAPGPLARPPGDTVAGSTASASRASRSWLRAVAACMPCGLACSLHAAVGRTSIGTVLPDIRDGRGNRDRTALIPSVAWTSLVTNDNHPSSGRCTSWTVVRHDGAAVTEAVEEFLAGGHGETFTFRGAEAGGHVLFGNVHLVREGTYGSWSRFKRS